jgi:hypothetical protein
MLARLVQLTRSLYPAAGTVTEDDDSSIGRCVTPHASLAKSVVQPPLRDQVHLIRPHAFRYHAGGCCSLRQTTTPRSVKPYHSPLSPKYIRLASGFRFFFTLHDPRFAGCPRSAYGNDVPAATACHQAVLALRTASHRATIMQRPTLRPTTTPHHLPCSASFILMDDLKR